MSDLDTYVDRQDAEMADRFEWLAPATTDGVREVFRRWVESWRTEGSERNFAIIDLETGEMIGDCEIELRDDGLVNVMYVVFSDWRKRGVATRAVHLLAQHSAETFPGRPLVFRIHPDNEASVRVARAAGAEPVGTERSRTGRLLSRWVAQVAPVADPAPTRTGAPPRGRAWPAAGSA